MNAELAKEIGRIAQSQQGGVEWDKVAKFSEIVLIFDSPELESLNYHQVFDAIEIYAIASNAYVTNDNPAWSTVRLFAKMMLQIDRAMMDLSCIEKIYTIAKRRYNDSLEPLHPCECPGERADNDWFKVKCLAEILLEEAKGGR